MTQHSGGHNGVRPAPYDLLGVGFGPANLALAAALADDRRAGGGISAGFLESKPRFGWHRGMLIDDATMQVSFLKDLVTLRDPTSPYSFLAYLSATGRLIDFVNLKTFFPTRLEFHGYLEWVAGQFGELVEYGTRVVDARPVRADDEIRYLDVVAVRGDDPAEQPVVRRTRNLVVASGLRPTLPDGVRRSACVWHSAELLTRVSTLDRDRPYRFVVVGAGQSAAEVAGYLHREFRNALVDAVFTRYGYSPADNTPFANRVFDPSAVDDFYGAPPEIKRRIFDYHANTNYSVVDAELIDDLYHRAYRERIDGRRRFQVHNMSTVAECMPTAGGARVVVASPLTGRTSELAADHVIYATGYEPVDPAEVLGAAAELGRRDTIGRFEVARDYRIVTASNVTCGIYLQGGTEHSHGISSSLLSNVAVRAGEILTSILHHGDSAGEPDAAVVAGAVDLGAR